MLFMFYTEIQDDRQKWRKNKFCQNHSILHCFRDKCIFVFYAEIQDGHQKWQENDF